MRLEHTSCRCKWQSRFLNSGSPTLRWARLLQRSDRPQFTALEQLQRLRLGHVLLQVCCRYAVSWQRMRIPPLAVDGNAAWGTAGAGQQVPLKELIGGLRVPSQRSWLPCTSRLSADRPPCLCRLCITCCNDSSGVGVHRWCPALARLLGKLFGPVACLAAVKASDTPCLLCTSCFQKALANCGAAVVAI